MARGDYAAAADVLETACRQDHRAPARSPASTSASPWSRAATSPAAWRCSTRSAARRPRTRSSAQPARPGQRRARRHRAAGRATRDARRLARARAPERACSPTRPCSASAGPRRRSSSPSRRWCRGPSWPAATPATPAVLEARIAVPFALRRAGRLRPVAGALQRSDRRVRPRERALDESIAAIRAGKLIDGLLERNPADEMGWFGNLARAARDAARRAPVAGAGAARVPGGLQELPRPALPDQATCRSGPTRSASSATCWPIGARPSPSGCRRCAAAMPRQLGIEPLRKRRDELADEVAKAEAEADDGVPSPTPSSASCSRVAKRASHVERSGNDPEMAAPRTRAPRRRRADLAAGAGASRSALDAAERRCGAIDAELSEARGATPRCRGADATSRPLRALRRAHRGADASCAR